MAKKIKVLIVDDSAIIRQTFTSLLEDAHDIEIVGTAIDPYFAAEKIHRYKPDVISLDIEMPRMDGLTFLKKIKSQTSLPVIIVSNQTQQGALKAIMALENGATDVLNKPRLITEKDREEFKIRLTDAIRSAYNTIYKNGKSALIRRNPVLNAVSTKLNITDFGQPWNKKQLIVIGASTGGVEATKTILKCMPKDSPPILIVQHMPEKFTYSYAQSLDRACDLSVVEARNNSELRSGVTYVAPGDYHMILKRKAGKYYLSMEKGDLVNRHRPSVNALFDSVAKEAGSDSAAILLTGMGNDGASGMLKIHEAKGYTIAQDEETSVVFGMPGKAIEHGGVNIVLPLSSIANEVCNYIKKQTM